VSRRRRLSGAIAAGAAGLAVAATAPAAGASAYTEALARDIENEIVYVDPKARPKVSTSEAGAVRLRIVKRAPGRIKIGVVPESRAEDEGGASGLAAAVGRDLDFKGTLMIVAGSNVYALTSHPASNQTVQAVDEAFKKHEGDRGDQLLAAVNGIAAVDPGVKADVNRPGAGGSGSPDFGGGEDFFDEVEDAVKLTTFIIGAIIAAPFLAVVIWIILRVRRGRKEQEEDWDYAREQLRNDLIALGDEIRALDVDTSMPDANRLGIADYEAAVAQYDKANLALDRSEEQPRLRIAEARAALKEGHRRISDAKVRLGVTPLP
jgi:hypothetical protein